MGNYIVSDAALTKIVEGNQDMPSIMVTTVFTYGVTHFDITELDIKELESIYGTHGLGTKTVPVQNITQNIIPNVVAVAPPSLNQTQTVQNTPSQIPQWIKHIAKWWSQNQVSNGEFTDAMKYLIQQGILKVPNTASSISSSQIPSWVTTNAGYWADGKISDYEFIRGIQYLISNGIIVLQ